MEEVAAMGIRDITICASSLGAAHNPVADMIEQGIVTGIQSSGVRGRIGEAISHGKLKNPAIIRSHGGRVRAMKRGMCILILPLSERLLQTSIGNAGVQAEKATAVFVLLYGDAKYANKVVVITDCLVSAPNFHPVPG